MLIASPNEQPFPQRYLPKQNLLDQTIRKEPEFTLILDHVTRPIIWSYVYNLDNKVNFQWN